MSKKAQIIVFTDGSALRNPGGPGGWAFLIQAPNGTEIQGAGGVEGGDVTNNRMELTAIIRAVEALPPRSKVVIFTDSQYAITALSRRPNPEQANADLIDTYRRVAAGHAVEFLFVRGHSGVGGNERVDEEAGDAARSMWLARYGETWEERDRDCEYVA